jgi:hypothetical protein
MGWNALTFLAEPAFVIPWYVLGLIGAVLVIADIKALKTPPEAAMRWAWPIVTFFFAPVGLLLYVSLARNSRSGVDVEQGVSFRSVNASVIHCVAGDGLGIVSAMIVARALGMNFWSEFWFEYITGFMVGWLVFQRKAMERMAPGRVSALAMAFRAEFFSMLAVMGGMGAVMTFVTPAVVGAQPGPLTYAFWGFAMLGLLAGYALGLPMNWLLLKVGWKGTGKSRAPREQKLAWVTLMGAFGALALAIPEWLTEARLGQPVRTVARSPGMPLDEPHMPGTPPLSILKEGLLESLRTAEWALSTGRRSEATNALDAAQRAAEIGAQSAPNRNLGETLRAISEARRALQMSDEAGAEQALHASQKKLEPADSTVAPSRAAELDAYSDVPVVDARGVVIGEVRRVAPRELELAIGGVRDAWGLFDLSAHAVVAVTPSRLLFGPPHLLAKSYVMLPVND